MLLPTKLIYFFLLLILPFLSVIGETTQIQELVVNKTPDEIIIGFNFKKNYDIEPQFTPFLSEDNYVYVVSKKGDIHCFNQAKEKLPRKPKYKVDLSSPPKFTPDGKVCFLSQKGEIVFLDSQGNKLASFSNNVQLFSPPVINHLEQVLFISKDGQLYQIDAEGNRFLIAQLFNPFDTIKSAFLSCDANNKAYVVILQNDNKLCCFDPEEKVFFGIFECAKEEKIKPDSILIHAGREILFATNNNLLYSIDAFGTLWGKYRLPCPATSPFAIDYSGLVSFGGSDEKIYYIDINKEEIWSHNINGKIVARPDPAIDGRMFFLNEDGYMYWNNPVPDVLELK